MSIASRIQQIEGHIGDIYDTLSLGGDSTQNKNIVNINTEIKREYKDFLANGTQSLWNNWEKVSGSGTSLTLNNTIKGKMEIEYGGKTSQEGTPTPSSSQDIHVVSGDNSIKVEGENLKNNATIVTGTFDDIKVIASVNGKFLYIPIKNNTTYTVSKIKSARFRLATTEVIPAIDVSVSNYTFDNNATSLSITTSSSAKYLLVYYFLNGTDTLTEQEILDSMTIYNETDSTTYPINLPNGMYLAKIGDYKDRIYYDNGKWYLEHNILKIVLDGTQEVIRGGTNTSGSYRFNITTPFAIDSGDNNYVPNILCNKLTKISRNQTYLNMVGISTNPNAVQVYMEETKTMTADDFKTYLSTNNLIVCCKLVTPTYEEITDTTLLSQLEAIKYSYNNQTNISQTNDDLPFELSVSALKEIE